MTTSRQIAIFFISAFALCGCAAKHFEKVEWATRVQRPEPKTSLIYFVRPGPYSGPEGAIVMDGDAYIGTLPTWGHLAYVTTPGKHLFAVVSEAADFMEAELEPGKTYYANVRRRMGVATERYSFVAHNESESIDAARKLVDETPQLRSNEAGRKSFDEKRGRILWIRNRYFPVWETNKTKQVLQAAAGR